MDIHTNVWESLAAILTFFMFYVYRLLGSSKLSFLIILSCYKTNNLLNLGAGLLLSNPIKGMIVIPRLHMRMHIHMHVNTRARTRIHIAFRIQSFIQSVSQSGSQAAWMDR